VKLLNNPRPGSGILEEKETGTGDGCIAHALCHAGLSTETFSFRSIELMLLARLNTL